MSWSLRSLFGSGRPPVRPVPSQRASSRLLLETLEDRAVPASNVAGLGLADGSAFSSMSTPAVLFVDDDGGLSGEVTWRNTLDALNVAYDYQAIAFNGGPVGDLSAYDTIIWSIGDRAYDNLTSANVAQLTAYLEGGGTLLYAGGHSVYSETQAQGFITGYLGLSNYQQNMPTFQSHAAPMVADGTGHAITGEDAYTLHVWPGGQYDDMFSGFSPGAATATGLLKLRPTNVVPNGINNFAQEYIAVLNETSTFRAVTWGFDLNHLDPQFRAELLGATLAYLGPNDTTPPAVSAPDLAAASDTGASDSDNVTNAAVLTFRGTAEAGSTVTLFAGTQALGTMTAEADGAWSFDVALAEGVHTLHATATDAAGNSSTSEGLTVTVDRTGPTVEILGQATAVPGETVLLQGSSSDLLSAIDPAALGWQQGTMTGSGSTFQFTPTGTGTYLVTFSAADMAGNTATTSLEVVVTTVDVRGADLFIGGTLGHDAIILNRASSAGGVAVSVNGVNRGSFAPTGRIVVFGQAGDDTIHAAANMTIATWMFGGDGNDRLTGGGGPNALFGGQGDDQITGGAGRDLLIGGFGADRLTGNGGDDLQIAGTTAYGDDPHSTALNTIMAEWGRTDRTFSERVTALRSLLNTDPTAGTVTVFDDEARDVLNGLSGQDWLLAQLDGDHGATKDLVYLGSGGLSDDVDAHAG